MNVVVTGRHVEVSEAMKGYAEQKASKLHKYYDRIQEIEVVFESRNDAVACEIIVNAEHRNMFIARHEDRDAYACIDACIDKLERQLTDHKSRVRNRKHPE